MAPQIAVYDAPEAGLRPTEIGVDATAAAARRVGAAYSESAQLTKEAGARIGSAIETAGKQAVDHITSAQVNLGAAAFAGIVNDKTKEWHDINQAAGANGLANDPSVAKNFLDGLETKLQEFKGGFLTAGGQQWAEQHVESLRNHFYQKTAADQTTAANQAFAVNANNTVNGLTNAAFWGGGAKADVDKQLGYLETSGLPRDMIEKSKAQIIRAGAMGGIKQNATVPDWVKEKPYSQYIDAADLKHLETAERQQQTQNRVVQKQQELYTKQENVQAVKDAHQQNRDENTVLDTSTGHYIINPAYFVNADKIRKMPEGKDQGEHDIAWGRAERDRKAPTVASNPDVHSDLLDRMVGQTDNPTTKIQIDLAENRNEITARDAQKMRRLLTDYTSLRDPVTKAALDGAKALLGTDPVGRGNYAQFAQNFIPQYQALPPEQRAGALDFTNKDSLISKMMKPLQRDLATKAIDKVMQGAPQTAGAAPAAFTPPPGSSFNAARKQYMFPDGSIHDLTGAPINARPAIPTVPASQ